MDISKIKTGTIVTLCLTGALLLSAKGWAVNAKAQDLMLQGYSECKSALLLRRKDLPKAKSAYQNFQNLKSQAVAIDAGVLEAKDPEVDRVVAYCNTVGADISRTEALPVIGKGTAACGEAANHLRNNEFELAQKAYSTYLKHKSEAIAISEVILEVFSVKTEVRRCERIAKDIEVAYDRSEETKQQLKQSLAYMKKTLSMCHSLTIAGNPLDSSAINRLKEKIAQTRARSEEVPNRAVLEENHYISSDQAKEIADLNKEIETCQASKQLAVDAKEQQLVELAKTEEARKRKALIEKQAAEQTAKHLAREQETEEERVARLSSNLKHYRLIEKVAPKYPESISYNRVGYAVVEYNIDTNGTVVEPKIISSTPAQIFDKAVLDAVKKWRYSAEFGDTEPDVALARTRIRIVP